MERKEWYLEYEIQINRPGLLGDISSLLGMLSINIVTINGVDEGRRGMLLLANSDEQITRLESILQTMDTINVTKLREPKLRDRLAVRHGRYIQRDADDKKHSGSYGTNWVCWWTSWQNSLSRKAISLLGSEGCPGWGKLNR